MTTINRRSRKLTVLVATLLALAGAVALTSSAGEEALADTVTDWSIVPGDTWINPVAPKIDEDLDEDARVSRNRRSSGAVTTAWTLERSQTSGNPMAAKQLAATEQEANRRGKNPIQFKQAPETQTAQLLTLLVEFNEEAADDFSSVQVPATVFEDRTCVSGNVQSGPLHNNIPNPADAPYPDNNTFWVEDFSSEHFNKLLYTDEGLTDPVRTDLNDGDGIDISGYTMRNHYLEMSKGAYTVDGAATPWVEVEHSEAWYGADRCTPDGEGGFEAGPPQRMVGHPDNPLGPGQMAIDAVAALMEQHPDFPLEDYDIEDQFDRDEDGEVFEPDGYIDHLVLVHAGEDKSGGGGEQGVYAIWAHSSNVVDSPTIGGVKIANYIVQPEDSGVGVFSHEYGHDLGLPDWYDTSGNGDSDIDFWDLMSSGSHSGPIFQAIPTHMSLWDKWVLGWADPIQVLPGQKANARIGQTSRTPTRTADGARILLPPKDVTLATPHSGEQMWWSNNDQDWADNTLARSISVPIGTDVRFWMWNDYIIEADWDYGFVEVSTDGGANWEQQKVFDEADNEVSTPDGYPDPNGRLADYGGLQYGLTGDTHGFRHDWVDLTPWAGQDIMLRLRIATDAAFLERGWFVDDLSITANGVTTWSDDAEANNGWTPDVGTFTATSGEGWVLDTGSSVSSHYYLVEWRTPDGFDEGLNYGYDTTYLVPGNADEGGAWWVERVSYNVPGLLVWYRDTSYGNVNHVTATSFDGPSIGSKGGLLLVDSHFEPMRHTGDAAEAAGGILNNFPTRMSSSDAAFTTWGTNPARDCLTGEDPTEIFCTEYGNRGAVSAFSDDVGWYPGIEFRPEFDPPFFFRDVDASTVIPSRDNAFYTTRIVDADGNLLPDLFGLDFGGGHLTGTGNPGDADVDYGVQIEIKNDLKGYYAQVKLVGATP